MELNPHTILGSYLMNFNTWFKSKFGREPSDSERDRLLNECFMAGANSFKADAIKSFLNSLKRPPKAEV